MYARTVASRELTFGVSGMLWRENLVMYDRQTDSWWAQAMGEAIHGEFKGTTLEIFPSQMMTWREWRARHPDTLVLRKPSGNRAMRDNYATYHASDRIGVTGFTRPTGGGLDPKTLVAAFRTEAAAFAVVADRVIGKAALADASGTPVVVAGTADGSGVRTFRSGEHRFRVATGTDTPRLVDEATGSEWDAFEGRAISGALAGRQLDEVPSTLSYWFAWRAFFPRAVIIRP